MDEFGVLQAWLLIGLPALLISVGLFVGRTPERAMAAFVVLLAGFAGMAMVDRVSAGVFAGLLALLYAAGRGGTAERRVEQPDWRRVENA